VLTVERAGRDLTVIGSVTVGRRGGNRWPRLGDGVFLGVGCRVLGDVDIGDGARVGANAVVVHDVAPGTTVVGVPARPIA
jgi:serine O-acetyltransferase